MNVLQWTGHEARALRLAMRLGQREFAEKLGLNDAAVSRYESPRRRDKAQLRYETQQMLDTLLKIADDDVKERFHASLEAGRGAVTGMRETDAASLPVDTKGVDQAQDGLPEQVADGSPRTAGGALAALRCTPDTHDLPPDGPVRSHSDLRVAVADVEVRRLLAHLITRARSIAAIDRWSRWRRRHQYRARISHYQRRLRQQQVRLEY